MKTVTVPVQLEDGELLRAVAAIAAAPFCEFCRAPMELRPGQRGAAVRVVHDNDCPALQAPDVTARRTT